MSDIELTNKDGISNGVAFTYIFPPPTVTGLSTVANPPGGPAGGGTVVNVQGTSFYHVTGVSFGGVAGTNILENSLDSVTATAPAGTGTVDVRVTTAAGTSAANSSDHFAYNSTLTMANGTGGYGTGTSTSTGTNPQPPVDNFNALSLVTGGSGVNVSSLTVVTQPASGTISFSGDILVYTPVYTQSGTSGNWSYDVTTTGNQTGTVAICATGFTYPSPGNCVTATMTILQSESGYYMGDQVSIPGITSDVTVDTGTGVIAPSTGSPGSTFTTVSAPAISIIPSTESGVQVDEVGQYSAIQPLPVGASLVPGSLSVQGGDATVSGQYIVSYCTAAMGYLPGECTANINTGNYHTTYPYIETFLNAAASVAGGGTLVLPTITAQFTVTASLGSDHQRLRDRVRLLDDRRNVD